MKKLNQLEESKFLKLFFAFVSLSFVIGAFIIGICENIIKALGYTTFSDAFTFALLIVILLFKPTGLFGEKTSEKV